MLEFVAHNLAPIMFFVVMAFLLLGYPVAFTLAAGGLAFFFIGVELSVLAPDTISLSTPLLAANVNRVFDVMRNETLLAVPFFTFMGMVLERSGMAEDLLETMGELFGQVRGGLAIAVILVGALLGATTGVVAASVLAMGLISLPVMLRHGYSRTLATGTILGAGSLAQIVPPSLVLIVMADQLGQPVGQMYRGALLPAAISIGLFALFVFGRALFRPASAPAMPRQEGRGQGEIWSLVGVLAVSVAAYFVARNFMPQSVGAEAGVVWACLAAVAVALAVTSGSRLFNLGIVSDVAARVVFVMIPPLALIFVVLGTIFLGIATPTEGGAMGAVGAMVLAALKNRLSFSGLREALEQSTRITAFVMFVLIGARIFSLTFYGIDGDDWIEGILTALPGGEFGFLIGVTLLVFILGCFLDFFEIAFIVIPFVAGAARVLDIDLVWLGIILSINLQISFLTPPFGFALFYLRSVAPTEEKTDPATGQAIPGIRTLDIYKGAVPFVALQAVTIALVMAFPWLVTHERRLPEDVAGQAVDAPAMELPGLSLPDFGDTGAGSGLSLSEPDFSD